MRRLGALRKPGSLKEKTHTKHRCKHVLFLLSSPHMGVLLRLACSLAECCDTETLKPVSEPHSAAWRAVSPIGPGPTRSSRSRGFCTPSLELMTGTSINSGRIRLRQRCSGSAGRKLGCAFLGSSPVETLPFERRGFSE